MAIKTANSTTPFGRRTRVDSRLSRYPYGVRVPLALALGIAVWPATVDAQLEGVGDEFLVNTFITNSQRFPAVAADANGDYVIVWEGFAQDDPGVGQLGVFGQRFDSSGPQGTEFPINTFTTQSQRRARVAKNSDGDFLVVWDDERDGVDVTGRLFSASGIPFASEFQINSFTAPPAFGRKPDVSALINGNFVVVWTAYNRPDEDNSGIFGQLFDPAAGLSGDQFRINVETIGRQSAPRVSGLQNGDFVVVWENQVSDGGIAARRFSEDAVPSGDDFQVNTTLNTGSVRPDVASPATGGFVVVWQASDGDDTGIFARRYDSNAMAVTGEFAVNAFTTADQYHPSVAANAQGEFVVAWISNDYYGDSDQDGDRSGIIARRFDDSSNPKSPELVVNTFTQGDQQDPAISMMGDQGIVTWGSAGVDDPMSSFQFGVSARRILAIDSTTSTTTSTTTTTSKPTTTTVPTTTSSSTTTTGPTTTSSSTTTTMPVEACGDPIADAAQAVSTAQPKIVTASDALFVLNAAVGLTTCEPCVCDTNGDGGISAVDSLLALQFAVGNDVSLSCPPCP